MPRKSERPEILGRADLIRVRNGNKPYQRQDAHSLLNPPSDNRNDELPFIYLGSRLGIEPADVHTRRLRLWGIEALEIFSIAGQPACAPKLVGRGHALSLARWPSMAEGMLTGSTFARRARES